MELPTMGCGDLWGSKSCGVIRLLGWGLGIPSTFSEISQVDLGLLPGTIVPGQNMLSKLWPVGAMCLAF